MRRRAISDRRTRRSNSSVLPLNIEPQINSIPTTTELGNSFLWSARATGYASASASSPASTSASNLDITSAAASSRGRRRVLAPRRGRRLGLLPRLHFYLLAGRRTLAVDSIRLTNALNPADRIDDSLFTGIKRMALAADVDVDLRRSCCRSPNCSRKEQLTRAAGKYSG